MKNYVKVVYDGVIISNAEPDSQCMIYQANGLAGGEYRR